MKTIFCKFWCFFDTLARARSATTLARLGEYEAARHLMSEEEKCKC
jgi:hypothetical protein